MTDTTIRITEETKEALDTKQRAGESYNDTVRRLADESQGRVWTEDEIVELMREQLQQMQTY